MERKVKEWLKNLNKILNLFKFKSGCLMSFYWSGIKNNFV